MIYFFIFTLVFGLLFAYVAYLAWSNPDELRRRDLAKPFYSQAYKSWVNSDAYITHKKIGSTIAAILFLELAFFIAWQWIKSFWY